MKQRDREQRKRNKEREREKQRESERDRVTDREDKDLPMNYTLCTHLLKIIGNPNRDGRAPVAAPRHRPVPSITDPIVETLLLHKLRDPGRQKREVVIIGCLQRDKQVTNVSRFT